MTGTRNPSRKYFKRNQPYFYKSADNWEEWDTDESYDRTFFIGIDDTNPADIDVALYMIWGGKAVAVVSSKVLDTVSEVVDTAKLLETEIQSILKEVQELSAKVAQSAIDIEQAITEMNALVDRCEGILDGAEAARDLAKDWATKMTGKVEEAGVQVDYSSKYYANEAKNSETAASTSATSASGSATTATEQATAAATSAEQAATSASTAASYASSAHIDASGAANSAQAAQDSATSAANSATSAANSETNSANSATASANSAQAAQNALNEVNGLIATPIGTIFMSVYVDESLDIARRLNGQLISSTKFTGFRSWLNTVQTANPNLFTTETNWQAEKTNSKLGQCGKFVVDDTAGTIRLPCVVNAQGLTDLQYLGTIKNESLPNINVSSCGIGESNSMFHRTAGYPTSYVARGDGQSGLITEPFASLTSSTYQNNAPVQQEAVQYPYYIQVATGIEETLPAIREYKTNVPYVLGDSKYFEANPYNASWLESNGQYNSSTVYPDLWSQLQVELNSSLNVGDTIEISGKTYVKRGLPVKLSTGTITDYDFVVNTANQTFRLPLLNGEEDLPSDRYENLTLQESGSTYTAPANGWYVLYKSATASGQYNESLSPSSRLRSMVQSSYTGGTSTYIFVKKGDVYRPYYSVAGKTHEFVFVYAQGNGTLYYYVGDTVQDASLINAGAVLGQLATKTNSVEAAAASMPSGKYIDLTLGASGSTYTAPANGYFVLWSSLNSKQNNTYIVIHKLNQSTVGSSFAYESIVPPSFQMPCVVPVKQGEIIHIMYTIGAVMFRFYYAEGEN